ncbi:MAG: hypothetical protein IJM29_04520 [Bacteroidales bacterium]|nr:hypothetical protein [Bacteroidales bacterium]
MKEFLEPVIIPYQPFLSDYKVTPDIFETYVDSFSRMARKGFISLDRIGAMYNPHNQDLLTIAWPSTNDNTLGQSGLLGVLPNLRDSSPTNEINTFIHMIDSQIGNYFPDYAVVKA